MTGNISTTYSRIQWWLFCCWGEFNFAFLKSNYSVVCFGLYRWPRSCTEQTVAGNAKFKELAGELSLPAFWQRVWKAVGILQPGFSSVLTLLWGWTRWPSEVSSDWIILWPFGIYELYIYMLICVWLCIYLKSFRYKDRLHKHMDNFSIPQTSCQRSYPKKQWSHFQAWLITSQNQKKRLSSFISLVL